MSKLLPRDHFLPPPAFLEISPGTGRVAQAVETRGDAFTLFWHLAKSPRKDLGEAENYGQIQRWLRKGRLWGLFIHFPFVMTRRRPDFFARLRVLQQLLRLGHIASMRKLPACIELHPSVSSSLPFLLKRWERRHGHEMTYGSKCMWGSPFKGDTIFLGAHVDLSSLNSRCFGSHFCDESLTRHVRRVHLVHDPYPRLLATHVGFLLVNARIQTESLRFRKLISV